MLFRDRLSLVSVLAFALWFHSIVFSRQRVPFRGLAYDQYEKHVQLTRAGNSVAQLLHLFCGFVFPLRVCARVPLVF